MGTRKSEWLAAVKPILEREEIKTNAKELARELSDVLELKVGADVSSLDELSKEFNEQLVEMGKKPVVFSSKTLHGIIGQFAGAIVEGVTKGVNNIEPICADFIGVKLGDGVRKGIADGITNGISDGFKEASGNFEAEFDQLIQKQAKKKQGLDKLYEKVARKEAVAKKLRFDPYGRGTVKVDSNFASYAESVTDKHDEVNDRLELAIDQGNVTEKLLKEWVASAKKYRDVYNTVASMDKDRAKTILGNNFKYFTDSRYESWIETGINAIDDYVDTDELWDKANEVEKELQKIKNNIDNMQQEHPELISRKEASETIERIQQIEQAYEKLSKTPTGQKTIDKIHSALQHRGAGADVVAMPAQPTLGPYDEGYGRLQQKYKEQFKAHTKSYGKAKEAIEKAFQSYDNSIGQSWDERYRFLIKAAEEFESIENNPNISAADKEDVLGEYRNIFENEIKPIKDIAREMLQDIVNLRDGKEPVTARTSAKEGGVAPGAEDVANAQKLTRETENKADAEKRAREEAEKKKLTDEASAAANHDAADEAERERLTKEANAKNEEERQRLLKNKDIVADTRDASGIEGASLAELEAAQKQIAELQEQKNRENEAKDAEIVQIRETSAAQLEAVNNEKATLQNDLDLARQQAQSAKDEVSASQAREAEADKRLAEQEILNQKLRDQLEDTKSGSGEKNNSIGVDDLKKVLKETTYEVKFSNKDTDEQSNSILINEEALKRIFKDTTFTTKVIQDDYQGNKVVSDVENIGEEGQPGTQQKLSQWKTDVTALLTRIKLHTHNTERHLRGVVNVTAQEDKKDSADVSELARSIKQAFADISKDNENSNANNNAPWAREDTLRNTTNGLLGKIVPKTDKIAVNIQNVAKDTTLNKILAEINTKTRTTPNPSGKASVGQPGSTSTETSTTKKGHKDGTISHGQAEGDHGSMHRLFDYYYWIEEQIEQFKDNELYVAQLQKVQAKILPKVVEYYEQLEKKGLEFPAWMLALDEKHDLHMSKIQGAQTSAETNKPLSKLYERYGMLMERAGAAGKNLAEQLYDEADGVLQIIAKLENGIEISPKMKKQLSDSLEKGRSTEENKQYEAMARKSDKDEAVRLKNIASLEKEIGKLEAERETSSNEGVKAAIEEEILLRQELIELQKKGLEMDAKDEAYFRESFANQTKEAKARAKQEQTDADKKNKEAAKSAKKAAQKEAMLGKTSDAINKAEAVWMAATSVESQLSPNLRGENGKIEQYYNKIVELRKELQRLQETKKIEPEDIGPIQEHTLEINKMTKSIGELISEYQRLHGDNVDEKKTKTVNISKLSTLPNYKSVLTQYIKEIAPSAKIKDFDASTKTLSFTMSEGAHEFTEYTAAVRHADEALVAVRGTTKKTETFFEASKRKMKEISSYISGMGVINLVKSQLKQGISYIKEIDDALTELKKVTNETTETYDKFLKTAAKTADKFGSTIKEIVSSTADWARLGYSLEEAASLAESTSVLFNVSEFDSIDSATSALVSTMQAFNYAAKDSMSIVDIMNEIGNAYAVSSDGIATALQDSASSLVAANNSYAEAVAMIAAGNRVIQDPSSLGSGLRTIALRLRGTSVEGEDDDGLITSTSKLQSKIKALSGVDILTDTGAYKSTYQILLEISDVWEQMSDIDQAALLEIIAGGRQSCPCVQKCA